MDKRIHLYISRKNFLTWLMAICMTASVVTRIVCFARMEVTGLWGQFLLPIAATVLYAVIALFDGEERFYMTAIPVWMLAAYSALWSAENVASKTVLWLFWIALVFFSLMYTEITSGKRQKSVWLLLPMMLTVLAGIVNEHREAFISMDWSKLLPLLPDLLILLGCSILVFAIRVHPSGEYHPTWGDRPDGRKIRTLPPMAQVSPYIMETRNTSTNYFSESFEITEIDKYIRKKRREGLTNLGIVHVFLACYCRAIARYPGLNRFIAGQKVYSRGDDIQFCMTIKKEMSAASPDTVIKVHLTPRDTIYDVYNKMNAEVEKVKNTPLDSSFDNTAHALMLVPGVFLRLVVQIMKLLDYFGMLPRFLLEVSPFHGSLFFTSMGSLGIPTIYHHLYDFGNLPVFGAFGLKRRAIEVEEDGTVVPRKYVDFKFTMDERIVDGYYYAAFFKHFKRLIVRPEILDVPPEEVIPDID